MTQSTDGKALVLGLLAGVGIGVAGLTLAVSWYRRTKENEGSITAVRSRAEFRNRLKASGPRPPSPRQADILETLSGLIRSLEEVKGEVQSLKEAVPRLEEQVRKELSQFGPERSPRKAARKRKRSERVLEDGDADADADADAAAVRFASLSSEEVESEGGYITAHTDTEEESEEEKVICSIVNTTSGSSLQEGSQTREFDILIQKADNLHENPELDKEEGFQLLLERKDQFWDQVEFLWRLARAYADMHDIAVDIEDKKNYAVIGLQLFVGIFLNMEVYSPKSKMALFSKPRSCHGLKERWLQHCLTNHQIQPYRMLCNISSRWKNYIQVLQRTWPDQQCRNVV
ncbi:regulator of microtubule dynamics protein 2 isoform X9 [Rhincodon typus]|uniref:regulator of microtubule dynamics protein 2 isoform X9 n=1 Tax=Rhincodon typus TaxID=259920 RepID=UPI00202EC5C6|nr:regulator of microtubule dynamics protein 2 isoform X9 [Rhincodon typus]